jgi:arylsulfatase A-like enzyme
MRPNILLVVFDTARADAFGPYGAAAGSTPVVDDLAARGTFMPMAIATASWTLPSHVSMFTGLHPRAFGLRRGAWTPQTHQQNLRALFERHADRVLPEVLRRAGYDTRGVSANRWITPAFGFDRGFESLVPAKSERDRRSGRLRAKLQWWLRPVDDGAAAAERVVRGWLRDRSKRPFFWFVNLMECHAPYYPPRPYNDLGPVDRWRAIQDYNRFQSFVSRMAMAARDIEEVPADSLRRMRHLYARAVRSMDDWLGRILQMLDERGVLDDTVVIVTSDHGENLGEGRLMGHLLSLDQRLVRVPLVSAGATTIAPKPLWSLAALPAAIAEAVGLEAAPWGSDEPIEHAFSTYEGLIQTPSAETVEQARAMGLEDAITRLDMPLESVTDGRFKLVRSGIGQATTEQLFDLVADPMESVDSSRAHPERAAALRGALAREHGRWSAAAPRGPRGADGNAPTPAEQAEIEEHLKALGYL